MLRRRTQPSDDSFYRRTAQWNRAFIRAYLFLTLLFAVEATREAIIHSAEKADVALFRQEIIGALRALVLSVGCVAVVQWVVVYPVGRRIYYYLWVAKILPWIGNSADRGSSLLSFVCGYFRPERSSPASLIHDSFFVGQKQPNEEGFPREDLKSPVYILREDLMNKRFWPDWQFAIVLLNNTMTFKRDAHQVISMEVSLCGQSFGIYNNAGKHFLRKQWPIDEGTCTIEKDLNSFLHNPSKNECEINLATKIPLRWASGGVLPIVSLGGEKYVALVFRDIAPQGWNLVNGASETRLEYKDPSILIAREFCEEITCLTRKVSSHPEVVEFRMPNADHNELIQPYYQKLSRLRESHDKVFWAKSKNEIEITIVPTKRRVKVEYHVSKTKKVPNTVDNILFQVNETEYGIEIIQIFEFEMAEGMVLLAGEIRKESNEEFLVREPIGLLSVAWLKDLMIRGAGSVGEEILNDVDRVRCKRLEEVPDSAQLRLFKDDLELREKRLKLLRQERDNQGTRHPAELDRLERWDTAFRNVFNARFLPGPSKDVGMDLDPLTSLCPTTWKAIEEAYREDLL
jgi:hypothetical protein